MSVRIPSDALAPLPPSEGDRARVQAIMKKVRRVDMTTKRMVDNALAGSYHSAFRGKGMDFDQVREYVPGDEVRTIDWNVTARAGRPFVKQFREERELTLMLAIDVSASGEFGSTPHNKLELAGELACVLAMSAVRNNDLVGLVMFSDRIERFVPPRKGRGHALRIVREVVGCRPRGRGTDLTLPLELLSAVLNHKSVVALVSDLEVDGPDAVTGAPLDRAARTLAARHDVVAIQIRDPHEQQLPDLGLVALEDAETGEVVHIDTGRRRVRERFAELARQRAGRMRTRLRSAGVDVVEVDTAHPYIPTLHAFFASRGRRH